MNKITLLKQISEYRPKALSAEAHKTLTSTLSLKYFQLNIQQTHLRSKLTFPKQKYTQIVDKMAIIGQIADEMDHHPEWTLSQDKLQIGLSTHQCAGKQVGYNKFGIKGHLRRNLWKVGIQKAKTLISMSLNDLQNDIFQLRIESDLYLSVLQACQYNYIRFTYQLSQRIYQEVSSSVPPSTSILIQYSNKISFN